MTATPEAITDILQESTAFVSIGRNSMCDVVVIGGGVIGLSIAFELSLNGVSVRILEQGQFGQEASWAGAGMLPPGNSAWAATAEAKLRAASHERWPGWASQLREMTNIDSGYVRCGGLTVRASLDAEAFSRDIARWRTEGVTVEPVSSTQLRERFPALNSRIAEGCFLPELGQVRNPWLIKALQAACVKRGVELFAGHPVMSIEHNGHRVHSVRTPAGEFTAGQFVVASGAWSGELARQVGMNLDIEPVRGQMVLLEAQPLPFSCVIEDGLRYMVPRPDGRILVGSTEERVGFDKRNTVDGVAGLLKLAQHLVPSLSHAKLERSWAGLRPHRPGGLPFMGKSRAYENVFVAAGHFRAGLQLSPITALLMRELILGQPTSLPLEN